MTAPFGEDPFDAPEEPESGRGSDDELIDDPAALEAAQAAVNQEEPESVYAEVGEDWVVVWGPEFVGRTDIEATQNAAMMTMPLDAESIRYAWEPYPPSSMYVQRGIARPFSLIVAPGDADRARELLGQPAQQAPAGRADRSGPAARPLGAGAPVGDLEGQQRGGAVMAVALLLVVVICAIVVYLYATGHYFGLARVFGP